MRKCLTHVGLVIAMALGLCWSEFSLGQETSSSSSSSSMRATGSSSTSGNSNDTGSQISNRLLKRFPQLRNRGLGELGTGGQQRSQSGGSASRSVSFTKNGKRVAIKENGSGVSVSIDGQTVHAKDAAELKSHFPEAYRLYEDHIGAARSGGMARGSAGGSSGGSSRGFSGGSSGGLSGGSSGGSGRRQAGGAEFNSNASQNRSVTVIENGKKVSISENENGITVSVGGEKIQAQNLAELRMKSPEAYGLYQQHFAGPGGMNRGVDAKSLLQDELRKMKNENAGNPQIQRLIEEMMRNVRQ